MDVYYHWFPQSLFMFINCVKKLTLAWATHDVHQVIFDHGLMSIPGWRWPLVSQNGKLAGGWAEPLWKIWKSIGMIRNSQLGWENKIDGNQTTNQLFFFSSDYHDWFPGCKKSVGWCGRTWPFAPCLSDDINMVCVSNFGVKQAEEWYSWRFTTKSNLWNLWFTELWF